MRYLIPLLACLFAAGCCTKVDCAFINTAGLRVTYRDFTQTELNNARLYTTDDNYTVLDSSAVSYYDQSSVMIYLGTSGGKPQGFEGKKYISVIGTRRDTITNIRYDAHEEQISCNRCYPFGHDKQTRVKIDNFRFDHNRQTFYGDSLIIKK